MAKANNQPAATYYQNVVDSFWRLTQGKSGKKNDSLEALEALIVKVETLTHLRRDQLAQAALALLGVYFIMSSLDGVLYTAFGLYYPLYQTVKAMSAQPVVEEEDDFEVTNVPTQNMRHWLAYWATYAAISPIDLIGTTLTGHLYLFVKTAFLVYLYLPQTSGALTVFETFIKPATISIGQTIASTVNKYRAHQE